VKLQKIGKKGMGSNGLRYSIRIFPYEIVLHGIAFKKSCGPETTI
jgi:hypothetical protein